MEEVFYPPDEQGRPRKADKFCSGFFAMEGKRRNLLAKLASEAAVANFCSTRPFRFTRRLTYDGRPIAELDVENVPRVYFSGLVEDEEEPKEPWLTHRYDYDRRFGIGHGARHLDETHRLVYIMTVEHQTIMGIVWADMKKDENGEHLTKDESSKPNHVSFQIYLAGDRIELHGDVKYKWDAGTNKASRTQQDQNRMKESSQLLSSQLDRLLEFRWKYFDPRSEKATVGNVGSVPETMEPSHKAWQCFC